MDFLVWFARLALLAQVVGGIAVLFFAGLRLAVLGDLTQWQAIGLTAGGVLLLAGAGFTALLFQISDRLLRLIHEVRRLDRGGDATPGGPPPGLAGLRADRRR